MTDLDKAREWAKSVGKIEDLMSEPRAAVEVIQSLPDHWVDVEKVQEIIEKMETPKNKPIEIGYDLGVVVATEAWRIQLEALIAPKLPTLADMTLEEREACQWMQCKLEDSDDDFVLLRTESPEFARLLHRSTGTTWDVEMKKVTPLPDSTKMKWPGGVVDCEIVDETPTDQQPNSSEIPKSSIKPEDVPANEPWLIEVDGQKAIGARYQGDAFAPWSVAALDGSFAGDYNDREVTLIHKLVPETHALPEGMRLADHAEHGRVVTSPLVDDDDDYKLFFLTEKARTGSGFAFAHESTLTFLDGEANE